MYFQMDKLYNEDSSTTYALLFVRATIWGPLIVKFANARGFTLLWIGLRLLKYRLFLFALRIAGNLNQNHSNIAVLRSYRFAYRTNRPTTKQMQCNQTNAKQPTQIIGDQDTTLPRPGTGKGALALETASAVKVEK